MVMSDKEILDALKNEMLICEARALGAQEAYKKHFLYSEIRACPFSLGQSIIVSYTDGDVRAVFCDVSWSSWEFNDYKGPAIFGRRILKSGKPSKVVTVLCPTSMLRNGRVSLAG